MKMILSLVTLLLATAQFTYAADGTTNSTTVTSTEPVLDVDHDPSLEDVYGSMFLYNYDLKGNNVIPLENLKIQNGNLANLAPDLKAAIRLDLKGDFLYRLGEPGTQTLLSNAVTGLGAALVYDNTNQTFKIKGGFEVGYLLVNDKSQIIGLILSVGAAGERLSDGTGSLDGRVGGKFLFIKAVRSTSMDKTREPVLKGELGMYWLPSTSKLDFEASLEVMSVEPFQLYHGSLYVTGDAIYDLKTNDLVAKFAIGASMTLGGLFDVKNLGYNAGQLYTEFGVTGPIRSNGQVITPYLEVGVRLTGTGDNNPHRLQKDVNKDNPSWLNQIVCRVLVCEAPAK